MRIQVAPSGLRGRRRVLALLAVLSVAVLSACGGEAVQEGDGAGAGSGNVVGIEVDDEGFRTPAIAPSGATFVVSNRGDEAHTFTAVDDSFDTGEIDPGGTAEIVIEQTGLIEYECTLHADEHNGTISLFTED